MLSPRVSVDPTEATIGWPVEIDAPQWYAIYSCANHEKRVADQLLLRRVEHFLPAFESVRRWKDRNVRLQLPLFPGYLFVRIPLIHRLQVLQVPGVVRLVSFNGHPEALPDIEIEALKDVLIPGLKAEPHPYLKKGRRVRIVNGPMQGTEGILIRKKNAFRVVISVDLILRAASVEVDVSDVRTI